MASPEQHLHPETAPPSDDDGRPQPATPPDEDRHPQPATPPNEDRHPLPATSTENSLDRLPAARSEETPDAPRSIDHRRERICVETSRHRIEGYVTLARDGFRSRVSDMLNASERDFLTLTDATVELLDGSRRERHRFLAVARRHIVYAVIAEQPGH